MAYRAAVCDDSAADADYVRGIVAHWAEQRGVALECRAFSSAEQFLFCLYYTIQGRRFLEQYVKFTIEFYRLSGMIRM